MRVEYCMQCLQLASMDMQSNVVSRASLPAFFDVKNNF